MASVAARRFSDLLGQAFGQGGVVSPKALSALKRASAQIHDARERAGAEQLIALVSDDRELDQIEVAPSRRAMAKLLGVPQKKLPAALEKLLTHAVPEPNVRVVSYDLTFDFSHDAPTFPARARIALEGAVSGTAVLEIDPARLTITQVRAGGAVVPFTVQDHRLRVEAPGAKALDIQYTVKPTHDVNGYGLVRDQLTGRMWTLTWPYNTGALFPSNSSPLDGVTATVTVRVAADTAVVGANAGAHPPKKIGDGTVVEQRLNIDAPVPAYDIALFTGPFSDEKTTHSQSGVAVTSHGFQKKVPAKVRDAYRRAAAEQVDFLTERLGPYVFGKELHLIEVPGWLGGMEHAGAVSLMVDSIGNVADATETAVHETTHHWFGNAVRIAGWSEFWMSEGFTNYYTFRFFGDRDGPAALRTLLDRGRDEVSAALKKRPQPLVSPAYVDIHQTFTDIPYQLGPWVLRMLEHRLGTAAFDAAIAEWFTTKSQTPVTTDELVTFLEAKTGQTLAPFFAAWGSLAAVPTYKDLSKIDGDKVTLKLRNKVPAPEGTLIPVRLEGTGGQSKTLEIDPRQVTKVEADFPVKRVVWDPERWVLAKIT